MFGPTDILYRWMLATPSATHMENDENENATPTQELPLKPKMYVFFVCFGASKMTLEDAGDIGYDTNK